MVDKDTTESKNIPGAIPESDLNELSKKYYGLSDKDIEELMVFIDEFDEAGQDIPDNASYEDLKPMVDSGNKIPSHCGHMIFSYFINRNGEDLLIENMNKIYSCFKELNDQDPESTNTTDLYELLAGIIIFCPHKVLRKFIKQYYDVAMEWLTFFKKRPGTVAVLMSCMAELFVVSKGDTKYSLPIVKTFQQMIDFIKEKDGITNEIPDALNVNFNELRSIIADYLDAGNKRESLKNVNKLINKKADVGQAFVDWVIANPSVAVEVIDKTESFTGEMILAFAKQMKIQHILETMVAIDVLDDNKISLLKNYIKEVYKLEDYEDYMDKLVSIVKRGGLYQYGILLRQAVLLPTSSEDSEVEGIRFLQKKLSAVANNLTADVSQKSMSITIVPLGRSRVYQDIVDALEGNVVDEDEGGDGKPSSFLAKLRDKDIVKKIRESGISYFAVDQYTGSVCIAILDALASVLEKDDKLDRNTLVKNAYKEIVMKYGQIMTLPYFSNMVDIYMSKVEEDDYIDEDEEDQIINGSSENENKEEVSA